MPTAAFYTCSLAGGGLIVDGGRREDRSLQTLDKRRLRQRVDLKRLINGLRLLLQRARLMLSRIFDVDPTYGGV